MRDRPNPNPPQVERPSLVLYLVKHTLIIIILMPQSHEEEEQQPRGPEEEEEKKTCEWSIEYTKIACNTQKQPTNHQN